MNLIVEFCIVFLICMAGEWIAALLPFTLPASVISLILHAKKEQGGEKSFLPASSFYFFYTFSPAFSIVSMEIPYPFVASESSTWVTAPTSFPF